VVPTYRGVPTDVKEFDVNGLRVILRPIGSTNHVIAAKLFIRGGITALPEDLSPAVEDLALQVPPLSGPQGMTKNTYRRLVDRMVTSISGDDGRDFSAMTLRCIDEKFDTSWSLFTGIIMHPQYDPMELTNAKERMVTGIRNRFLVPESYATYLADSVFFHGHPYGRVAQEGDVAPLTAKTLEDYYRDLFVKSRLLLVVVGNVDSADLHRKIAGSLALLPQGDYHDPVVPDPPNSDSSIVVIRKPIGEKTVTNYIVARYLAPRRDDSLYYPMLRLTSFLSGSLFREVRIERNLSYAPDASVNFGKTSFGEISISTTLPDSAWRVANNEVLDFFRNYIINEESMKLGVNSWITFNYVNEQTNESQAQEMGTAELYTGSWANAFRTVEAIRNMTPVEMNLAAQLYLRNMTVAIVGDPSVIHRTEYLPKPVSIRHHGGSASPEEGDLPPNDGEEGAAATAGKPK
jgi:predicted Zn-dependent peptidase